MLFKSGKPLTTTRSHPVISALDTTHLLLAALRPDAVSQSWQQACEQAAVDWDDLAVRAIVLGLAPQLHRRLQDWDIEIPQRSAAKLAVTHQAHAQRNQAIFAQLDQIVAACAAQDVQPIALKGVHLAAAVYAEPALRPMNDIDLLFEPAEMARVVQVFNRLGYEQRHKAAELGAGVTKHTSTFRRSGNNGSTPNPYLSAAGDRTVEPHVSLQESWYGLQVDVTPGMRSRAVTVTPGEQPLRALAAEDLLLHLSVHFTFHLIMGAPALVQLCDLLVVSQIQRLQWDLLLQQTRDCGATPYVLAALFLAQRLLHAPVPGDVLARLGERTPGPLSRHILNLDLRAVLQRTQQQPWRNTPQRLLHGLRARAETARWAPDAAARLRVWQTAFQISRSDTGRELLQKAGWSQT